MAKAKTLAILPRLDARYKGIVLQYLYDMNLIGKNYAIAGNHVYHIKLTGTNLSGVDLIDVDLRGASLSGANLRGAVVVDADLSEADLREADLSGANLIRVKGLTRGQLDQASSLKGATMPDGSMHS